MPQQQPHLSTAYVGRRELLPGAGARSLAGTGLSFATRAEANPLGRSAVTAADQFIALRERWCDILTALDPPRRAPRALHPDPQVVRVTVYRLAAVSGQPADTGWANQIDEGELMSGRTLHNTIKRITAGAAALAVVPALGIALAGSASAAGDTKDNHWQNGAGGSVMWNDYKDSDHGDDVDNIWVDDYAGDGKSVKLSVKWNGKWHSAHAYNNEIEKVSFGNVPNGERVYFRTCEWNNGEDTERCLSDWFYE